MENNGKDMERRGYNIQRCTAKLFAKTLEFSKTSVSISQVKAKLFIFFQCYSSMLNMG